MTKRTLLFTVLIATSFCCPTTFGQSYRNQDSGLGGLAGAVIGGIIGHQNDEVAEGALIGGAVGAIAGGLVGTEKDRQVQRNRYYHQQAYRQNQHQAWQRQQVARSVSINDVVSLSQSGVSDSVILNQIRANGVSDRVGTHEIIAMHNKGVSEPVITAMQIGPSPLRTTTTLARAPRETIVVEKTRPVIVREEVRVVPRPVYVPPPRVRYATRPAYPPYPTRATFRTYW